MKANVSILNSPLIESKINLIHKINLFFFTVIGVGWKNFFVVGDKNYTDAGCLGNILIFSILGLIIHFSLALYASALFPGKYGVPKHPLYFLKVRLCH